MSQQLAAIHRDSNELREAIIRACLFMRDRLGYFVGTWGNISVRIEDGLLVTPSRMAYDAITANDLVVVGWEGGVVRGHRVPTSELELHRQILRRRPDIGALVHSHSPWASVCACAHRSIPVLADDMAEVIGGEVRCAPHVVAGRHRELAQAVAETIGPDVCAVLLGNHGAVAGGRDLAEAVVASQFLEKAAMILIQAEAIGGVRPIAEELWREERHRYLYKYGKPEDLGGVDLISGKNEVSRMYDVVTVGEGMLRLSPPRYERIRRARTLDVHMCGSQGNVASNIARLGLKTAFVTKLPDNALGLLANDHYMSCGVDTSHIKFVPNSRLGVNYLEFGATPRASAVVYDRKGSAASTIASGDFDWDKILKGTRLAYTDGIFPGLSPSCRHAAVEFIAAAKRNGCLVGFDVNYREHLWPPQEAKAVMAEIIPNVDILITTQWDSEIVFGYGGSYEDIIRQFHRDFGCNIVGITLREVYDVLRGAWNTMVLHEGKILHGRKYDIDVIDRFGAGDSWGSGFLYAYLTSNDLEYAMNFGNAVCALHHTIPGDVAQITSNEVEAIMRSKDFREKR